MWCNRSRLVQQRVRDKALQQLPARSQRVQLRGLQVGLFLKHVFLVKFSRDWHIQLRGLQSNLDVLKLLRCLQTLDVLAGEKEKHFFSSLYTSLDVLQLLTCVTWRGSRTSSRPTVSRDEVREPCHVTGYLQTLRVLADGTSIVYTYIVYILVCVYIYTCI